MPGQCFDKCSHETNTGRRVRYEKGEVRCQVCEYNKVTDMKKCYCCNHMYRTKPRVGKSKNQTLSAVVRY